MDDESIFTRRPKPPKWLVDDADRQWADIPDSPADIAAWSKGDPINPVKPGSMASAAQMYVQIADMMRGSK